MLRWGFAELWRWRSCFGNISMKSPLYLYWIVSPRRHIQTLKVWVVCEDNSWQNYARPQARARASQRQKSRSFHLLFFSEDILDVLADISLKLSLCQRKEEVMKLLEAFRNPHLVEAGRMASILTSSTPNTSTKESPEKPRFRGGVALPGEFVSVPSSFTEKEWVSC